jgi:uncharacterized protein
MGTLRKQIWIVMAAVIATATAGLAVAPSAIAAPKDKGLLLHALCTRGGSNGTEGCTSEVTIKLDNSGGSDFRVSFSEDEVAGTGDQWRAAGWNAATTATLLTGAALGGRTVEYELNGQIDGPSAGALMTVGVISLLRGDKIKDNVTMTGTINPDGTIGPVGGIPLKVAGAVEAKKTVMLIPQGQRNSEDEEGNLVDVVDIGRDAKVDVREVGDIYDAYKEFTGKTLPKLASGGNTALSSVAYNKLEALTKEWTAEFNASDGEFGALDPAIQSQLGGIASLAADAGQRSDELLAQGVQAGAYLKAVEAAAYANATVKTGQALQIYLTQGADPFISQIKSSASVQDKADAFFSSLENVRPKTLSEASALVDAYGNAIDALSLSGQASDYFNAAGEASDPASVVTLLIEGAVIDEVAGTVIDAAKDLKEFASDLPGPPVKSGTNLKSVADFFRKAAEANLTAFDSLIIKGEADENGVSEEVVKNALANQDSDYLLAIQGSAAIGTAIDDFVKNKTAAAYANLGGATVLYARTATLLAKYYSLGAETDDNGAVIGLRHPQALTNALELGQDQASGVISVLRAKKTDPASVAGVFEVAGVEREGDLDQKLQALSDLTSAYVSGRLLAYLGGFPTAGLQ